MIEPAPTVLFTADELAMTTRARATRAEMAEMEREMASKREPLTLSPEQIARRVEREQVLAPHFRREHLEKVISGGIVPGFLSPDERAIWDRRISELRDIYNQACARLGTPELPH